jgi:hypothetical protein
MPSRPSVYDTFDEIEDESFDLCSGKGPPETRELTVEPERDGWQGSVTRYDCPCAIQTLAQVRFLSDVEFVSRRLEPELRLPYASARSLEAQTSALV